MRKFRVVPAGEVGVILGARLDPAASAPPALLALPEPARRSSGGPSRNRPPGSLRGDDARRPRPARSARPGPSSPTRWTISMPIRSNRVERLVGQRFHPGERERLVVRQLERLDTVVRSAPRRRSCTTPPRPGWALVNGPTQRRRDRTVRSAGARPSPPQPPLTGRQQRDFVAVTGEQRRPCRPAPCR